MTPTKKRAPVEPGSARRHQTRADNAENRDTSVGARLRRAREARGLTLREVAESSKISVTALESIERDDLKRLPGGIYTRAFVRTYAQAVGLPADETLGAFLAQAPDTAIETGALPSPEPPPAATASPAAGAVRRALASVAVPVFVIVLYIMLRPAPEEPAVLFDRRPLRAQRVHALAVDIPAPTAHAPAAWQDLGLVRAVNQHNGITVVLEPRRRCWIGATLDGTPGVSRLLAPGDPLTLEAEHEIVLKLGDAGAVSVTVNGEPVRRLGDSGQVVTARFAPDTVSEFASQ